MSPLLTAMVIIGSYILGSVPSAVWVGKLVHGVDVREYGSGNAGATNVFRILGWKTAIPVLLIDAGKGFIAVKMVTLLHALNPVGSGFIQLQILCGISAMLGHVFPLFAGFKGGKGVATTAGVILAILPNPFLIAACVFFFVLFVTQYVSVSSIMAGLSFPISVMFIFRTGNQTVIMFALAVFILILVTHRKNIERLLRGTESKLFRFRKTEEAPEAETAR